MLERFLTGIYFATTSLAALCYFINGRKNNDQNESKISYAYCGMLFGQAGAIFFLFFAQMNDVGYYVGHLFYIEDNHAPMTLMIEIFVRLSNASITLGFTIFLFYYEILLDYKKHLLTIINIIGLGSIIFIPDYEIVQISNSINFIIMILITPLLLVAHTNTSDLSFKPISIILLTSFVLFFLGHLCGRPSMKELEILPLELALIISIISSIYVMLPLFLSSDIFNQNLYIWVIFCIISLIALLATDLYAVFSGYSLFDASFYFSAFFLYSLGLILIMKNIKSGKISKSRRGINNILESVFKPKMITEEEVSVAKEKGICIICKNEIFRETYVCPECKSYYCLKCSETLAGMENACWVCDTPFDESKPQKIFEKVDDLAKIEADSLKKHKI